jgi:hypothetical protein
MKFRIEPDDIELDFIPEVVVIASHTGRDTKNVESHIRELVERGVRPSGSVPEFFVTPSAFLSQSTVLETASPQSSGEAEFALLVDTDETYVTVASDHTDRAVQQFDIQLSKQICPKAVGASVWRLNDVADRWDRLVLRGRIGDEALDLYQEGELAALLPPARLLELVPWRQRVARFVVLGGTLPAIGGLRVERRFRAELADLLTGRTLSLEYRTELVAPLAPPLAPNRPTTALMANLMRAERRLDQ